MTPSWPRPTNTVREFTAKLYPHSLTYPYGQAPPTISTPNPTVSSSNSRATPPRHSPRPRAWRKRSACGTAGRGSGSRKTRRRRTIFGRTGRTHILWGWRWFQARRAGRRMFGKCIRCCCCLTPLCIVYMLANRIYYIAASPFPTSRNWCSRRKRIWRVSGCPTPSSVTSATATSTPSCSSLPTRN